MPTPKESLLGFILIKTSTVTSSPSGLFINVDLPITLDRLEKMKEADQSDIAEMWDEIQARAIKKFVIRVKLGYRELFGVCNLTDDWFDKNKDNLAVPLLYYLGSELMFEQMFSTRVNRYTTIDREKATEMKASFDKEFSIQLKAALEIIEGSHKGESGDVFAYREVLP